MNLPRRFLNLVLENQSCGVKSLHRIDLERQSFFNPAATRMGINWSESAVTEDSRSQTLAADVNKKKLKTGIIRLPGPSISFSATPNPIAWRIDCLPLTENKIVCLDQSGRAVLYHSDENCIETMPSLYKPKQIPISLSIRNTEQDCPSLFVMEKISDGFPCYQFEAFIQETFSLAGSKAWRCQSLPLPPYFYEGKQKRKEIKSYAVLGGGSHICFSLEGFGTYCFDTESHKWSHLGKWTLPFYGKAEYVPELKLWFGLSAEDHLLCADLSDMDSRPQLVNTWNELAQPEGWEMARNSELVYLGSGRFCIARFYDALTTKISDAVKAMPNDSFPSEDNYSGGESFLLQYESFSVITGVEVVPHGPVDKHNSNGSCSVDSISGDSDSCNGSGTGDSISSDIDSCNGIVDNYCSSVGSGNGNEKGLRMIKHKSKRYTNTGGRTIVSIF